MPSIYDWNAVRTEHHGTKETKIFEQHAGSCDYHDLAEKFAQANWHLSTPLAVLTCNRSRSLQVILKDTDFCDGSRRQSFSHSKDFQDLCMKL